MSPMDKMNFERLIEHLRRDAEYLLNCYDITENEFHSWDAKGWFTDYIARCGMPNMQVIAYSDNTCFIEYEEYVIELKITLLTNAPDYLSITRTVVTGLDNH